MGRSVHRVGWVRFLGATVARFNNNPTKASSDSKRYPCPPPLASKGGPSCPLSLCLKSRNDSPSPLGPGDEEIQSLLAGQEVFFTSVGVCLSTYPLPSTSCFRPLSLMLRNSSFPSWKVQLYLLEIKRGWGRAEKKKGKKPT